MIKPVFLTAITLLTLSACGEKQYNEIDLMPSPLAYTNGTLDPFKDRSGRELETQSNLFYATDRAPSGPEDKAEFYANRRGVTLRVGTAKVAMDPPIDSWQELRDITTASKRDQKRTLTVSEVTEIGPIDVATPNPLVEQPDQQTFDTASAAFRTQINQQLARSNSRDAYIYIHGYNVDFAYPTLAAKELQHYLGYQGAFVSYNWPATPNRFAYLRDLETADATRRNLRGLIEFLSTQTNVSRVHLIGYSAGSRLTFEAAYQIALLSKSGQSRAKLGQVILIGSDLDRHYFTEAIADGLLDSLDQLSIYMSASDSALAISRIVFGENRLGQFSELTEDTRPFAERLAAIDKLALIDVTEAEGASLGNGHWYFRSSPWASSDIFLTLLTGEMPQERGLVRLAGEAAWHFPEDYPQRLQAR
ncbi:alpha/beta hydrolase [Shimia abyssi]|uniref:Esterase/lipase superfamily enzyme n=1 Tax=Shimia abyssi TaxID=1662395 RepID=A0A2P8F6M8_9RHOB|nr:alpha/beta hydrolase [Shimia abyssi]PSL17373.1 esterase/lipase superfamily enzyme [Shimia abyssi]